MNEIDNNLFKQVQKNKTPSVHYVIFNTDSIIHKFQFGFSDLKNEQKTSEATTYHAYSVTKTFTALSILQLAEQKKLDIEQPVKKHLPEFLYSSDITIRQKILFTENYTTNNKATGMCLSWFTGKLNGKQYFAHAGGGGGYYCEIRIYPDLGVGNVIMFNRTGMSDERYLGEPDKLYC